MVDRSMDLDESGGQSGVQFQPSNAKSNPFSDYKSQVSYQGRDSR